MQEINLIKPFVNFTLFNQLLGDILIDVMIKMDENDTNSKNKIHILYKYMYYININPIFMLVLYYVHDFVIVKFL